MVGIVFCLGLGVVFGSMMGLIVGTFLRLQQDGLAALAGAMLGLALVVWHLVKHWKRS
jgi:hypothetical protein